MAVTGEVGRGIEGYHGGISGAPAEIGVRSKQRLSPWLRGEEFVSGALPIGGFSFLKANEDVFGVVDVDLVEHMVFWSLC